MDEQEAIQKMVAPGTRRPGKYREGVIQIHVTRACDKACYNCTQGSQLRGRNTFMPPDLFRRAVQSLSGYYGVVGVFGGNPALHPQFEQLCRILEEEVPYHQRGIWCNNPIRVEQARIMQRTFDPSVSNLNVHLDKQAYLLFKEGWPQCNPVGLTQDSRHSPVFVAMKDVLTRQCPTCIGTNLVPCPTCNNTGKVYNEAQAWDLISRCDINHHWSAMIGLFRGELRAWFCEVAGAQSILHQDDPDYPDTGIPIQSNGMSVIEGLACYWWRQNMWIFQDQVRKHCHDCGVPLRGYGELAQAHDSTGKEQVSQTHESIYLPKRKDRRVELVTVTDQLELRRVQRMTDYLGNSKR